MTDLAFFNSLQNTIRAISSAPTYSAELPAFPVRDLRSLEHFADTGIELPPKSLVNYLLSMFSQHCTDTLYFVHQVTMLLHVEAIYSSSEQTVMPRTAKDRWILTRMFAMLALGALHSNTPLPLSKLARSQPDWGTADEISSIPGMKFFILAKKLVPIVSDCRGVDAVQALSLMVCIVVP